VKSGQAPAVKTFVRHSASEPGDALLETIDRPVVASHEQTLSLDPGCEADGASGAKPPVHSTSRRIEAVDVVVGRRTKEDSPAASDRLKHAVLGDSGFDLVEILPEASSSGRGPGGL
jgi:hypothetical protein